MDSGLYLIHEDNYIAHIDDKVGMYDLLTRLVQEAREQLAVGCIPKALRVLTKFEAEASETFAGWGVPKSYIESGDADELYGLMLEDLASADGEAGHCRAEAYYADPMDSYGFDMEDEEEFDAEDTSVSSELLDIAASLTNTANHALQLCSRVMEEEYGE